ncbi:MAG: YwiC-like family protein [Opitutus sp.]
MSTIANLGTRPTIWRFPDLMMPKEHGSWSLALEPVALGLIIAPSIGGAWLAVAVIAGFFARRPLRIALQEHDLTRRDDAVTALALCATVALVAFSLALVDSGTRWTIWLVPTFLAGAIFLFFDLNNHGRAEAAEIAGAAAFGSLPAAFVAIHDGSASIAIAAALVMLARVLPAVVGVRAILRARKTGTWCAGRALLVSAVAVAALYALTVLHLVASLTGSLLSLLIVPLVVALVLRCTWKARMVGMAEALLGIAYVLVAGFACRL